MRTTREQLAIEIGQVPFRLLGNGDKLYDRAVVRYAPFVAARRQGLPISILPRAGPPAHTPPQFRLQRMTLEMTQQRARFTGVKNEYGLDSLLRVLLSHVLLRRRGFLLHAATMVSKGRAYVFMGRSGAGKSTVASLSPAGSVLTDEVSLIRFVHGAWRAFGTPFWGEFRAAGQNISVPLAGIFSLVQAAENLRTPLFPKPALTALLANTLFFSSVREDREKLLGIQSELLSTVPIYRFEFRKEITFWEAAA